MLPFLKPKDARVAGVIVQNREPDYPDEIEPIEGCAQELIRAIHAKDAKATAEALKDAFSILDAEPHVEGEHIEE